MDKKKLYANDDERKCISSERIEAIKNLPTANKEFPLKPGGFEVCNNLINF